MSIFSKWRGKPPSSTPAPTADEAGAPLEPPAALDPAAQAREEEAALEQAIADGDVATVGRWVIEGRSTRIRQRAAQAISDPGQLHELILATRHGKDKQVYRILTAKRDERLAEERRARELQEEIASAAAAIAEHCVRACDASSPDTLARLEARWSEVATQATPQLREEVARRLSAAREGIERHRNETAAEAERRRAEAQAAEEAKRQRAAAEQAAAAAAAEEARRHEAERQAELDRRAAEEARVRELVGLLRQAQAALGHGASARAARLREAVAEKLPEATGLPPWFARQLQQVDERIEELKDWKTFRVAPRRAELLQQMQGLVGARMSPEELARHIRHLREEWRTLRRGAGEDEAPESQQFEAAAEQAYAPCREHFARQAEQRRDNQARREALLERLAAFVEAQPAEAPDWRLVSQVIVEARDEWRQYAPVDPAVVESLQARFHALLGGLRSRLEAEHAKNVEAKRALIARAAELVNLEDTRAAIEESKQLQRTWKTVGIVPRRQDNALWEEFRRHCDAVFQRISQESAAQAAALEANHAQAAAVCEELERIAGLDGEPLQAGLQQVRELRTRFEVLELPRSSARDLRQRFARAMDRCSDAERRERAAAARRGWTDLFAATGRVRAYALATVEGRPAAECEALRASAEAAVEGLAHASKGTRAVLQQQLAAIDSGTISTDLVANAAALRLLCVRAELIAGVETPLEDSDLRRQYQMQRLVDAMAHRERDTPANLDQLAKEWIAVGPVEPAVHHALLARFARCRDAL